MTKYLTITEQIDPKAAQARKDVAIEEAEDNLREAQDALMDALAKPLVTEVERQIEVQPGHPDYDKASETYDYRLFMGDWRWTNQPYERLLEPTPWLRLIENTEFPPDMGEVTTK